MLGGQVIAELGASGNWTRGYVYLGGQMLAIQNGAVNWVHQDPVTKSQRVTNSSGAVISTIDLDPWGGETNRSANSAFQPHKYTTYERDGNGGDDAMMRRYQANWTRFSQPDPYDGSYDVTDPQSFNRYSYVQNDPVNFTDPSGLNLEEPYHRWSATEGTSPMGFMSPGIHTLGGWWQTGDRIDGVQTWYPAHYYTYTYVVGGIFASGGRVTGVGGNDVETGFQNSGPQKTQPPATGYTCATIGGGPLSVSGIVDSNSQVYGALGIGFSWPPVSYSQTQGSGPVQPGLHVYGSVSNVLAVTLSTNVFHPVAGRSRQVGGGTPAVGVGFQVVVPVEGTTARDWEHHPDNPNGKGPLWHAGRCPY